MRSASPPPWGVRKVVVLDRCGHMPQEERPAEVARLIAGFLAEASAGER